MSCDDRIDSSLRFEFKFYWTNLWTNFYFRIAYVTTSTYIWLIYDYMRNPKIHIQNKDHLFLVNNKYYYFCSLALITS